MLRIASLLIALHLLSSCQATETSARRASQPRELMSILDDPAAAEAVGSDMAAELLAFVSPGSVVAVSAETEGSLSTALQKALSQRGVVVDAGKADRTQAMHIAVRSVMVEAMLFVEVSTSTHRLMKAYRRSVRSTAVGGTPDTAATDLPQLVPAGPLVVVTRGPGGV